MPAQFRHEAVPYAGADDFVSSAADAVRDALAQDHRPIVLASSNLLGGLRDVLQDDDAAVTLVPTDSHGRNPSRLMTMMHSFLTGNDGRACVAVKDSVLGGRSAASRLEARYSEYVLNSAALQNWPLSVQCLYDTEALDDDAAVDMRRSHPQLRGQDGNVDYSPDAAAQMYAQSLGEPPVEASRLVVGTHDLAAMRDYVRTQAEVLGIAADRSDDLVLAANEIVTNSLRHGGGRASMAIWDADDALVCEVHDSGYIEDPLVGRFAPPASATHGRGVWLAHHLCDLVQLRSSPEGTVVRMHVDR